MNTSNDFDDIDLDDAVQGNRPAKPETKPLKSATFKKSRPAAPHFRIAEIIRMVANDTNMGWHARTALAVSLATYFEGHSFYDEEASVFKFSHEDFYREIFKTSNMQC